MQRIGGYLLFFGIGSIILSLLEMNFILLMWIDNWGESIGWTIRIGITILGGIFTYFGANREEEPEY